MTDSPRWSLKHPTELHVREWDGSGVVYDGWTGDTHQLDALSLELLALLAIRPSSSADLAQELADVLGPDSQDQVLAALAGLDLRALIESEDDS